MSCHTPVPHSLERRGDRRERREAGDVGVDPDECGSVVGIGWAGPAGAGRIPRHGAESSRTGKVRDSRLDCILALDRHQIDVILVSMEIHVDAIRRDLVATASALGDESLAESLRRLVDASSLRCGSV
jgi:hypothetical protein